MFYYAFNIRAPDTLAVTIERTKFFFDFLFFSINYKYIYMEYDIKSELSYDKDITLGYEFLEITTKDLNNIPITVTPSNFKTFDRIILVAIFSTLRYQMIFGDKSNNDLFKRNAIIRFLIEELDPYLRETMHGST